MKSIFCAVLMSVTCALAWAGDTYVYWQAACPISDFAYATISQGGTLLEVCDEDGGTGSTRVYPATEGDRETGPVYSKLADAAATGDLIVELWGSNDGLIGSNVVSYASWQGHAYSDLATSGATPLAVTVSVPILAEPVALDNATPAVYTNGVLSSETSEGSGKWLAWSNEMAIVVYTADSGCCFEDGTTVKTNTFDTTKNPATAGYPENPRMPATTVTVTAQAITNAYTGAEQRNDGFEWTAVNPAFAAEDISFTGVSNLVQTFVGTTNMNLKADDFALKGERFWGATFVIAQDGILTVTQLVTKVIVTPVAHTTNHVYVGEEELSGSYLVPSNATDVVVVYEADDGYYFSDGTTAKTNKVDCTTNPATAPAVTPPNPSVDYLVPVYKGTDNNPTNGIDHWITNSVYNYTAVTGAAARVTWGAASATSWYVVTNGTYQIDGGVTCKGYVNLILCDGAKLTVTNVADSKACIQTDGSGSFTIYGTPDGAGELSATGGHSGAGIGGDNEGVGTAITVNGGTVTATGGEYGAGIGGGRLGAGSAVTVNGGVVTATGGSDAAGIGGGQEGDGSAITVNGGTVTATGDQYGAGIGGGLSGAGHAITINGGTVTAKSLNGASGWGAGIGGGDGGAGYDIVLNGGTVEASNYGAGAAIGGGGVGEGYNITVTGGDITALAGGNNYGHDGAAIGGGCDRSGHDITISGGTVWVACGGGCELIGSGNNGSAASGVTIAATAQVMFDLATGGLGLAALPTWEGFSILTPETQTAGRVLVGGIVGGAWMTPTSFPITNAVTGVASNITVNGEMIYFAKRYLTLTNDVSASNLALKVIEPVSFTPTPVVHTSNRVYVDGVEIAGSASYFLPSNATDVVVVYEADEGYHFPGGAAVVTNTVTTSTDPATAAVPPPPFGCLTLRFDVTNAVTGVSLATNGVRIAETLAELHDLVLTNGDRVAFAFAINPSYTFATNTDRGVWSDGTNWNYTVAIGGDTTSVVRVSAKLNACDVTVSTNGLGSAAAYTNGTVLATKVRVADVVTLKATPGENHQFLGWTGNAAFADATQATTTFTMGPSNVAVTANFIRPDVTYTPEEVSNAKAKVYTNDVEMAERTSYAIPSNLTATVVYTANDGYYFSNSVTTITNTITTSTDPASAKQQYTPKRPTAIVTITAQAITNVYTGAAQKNDGFAWTADNAFFTTADFTFAGISNLVQTSAGTTNMNLKASDFAFTGDDRFWGATFTIAQDGILTVTQRCVTVTSGSQSFTYDGQPHAYTNLTVTAGSFVAGEGIATSNWATVTYVGAVSNAFDYAAAPGTSLSNYAITVVTGAIAVVAADIGGPGGAEPGTGTVPAGGKSIYDVTVMYDGAGHTIGTNALTGITLTASTPEFTYALTQDGTYQADPFVFTNVVTTSFWYKVSATNYNDYAHEAKVTVTNRPVTVTSADKTKPWDGTPLKLTTEDITEAFGGTDGGAAGVRALPEGESFVYGDLAERTDVGTSPAAFSISAGEGTLLSNYAITCVTGTLTVVTVPMELEVTQSTGGMIAAYTNAVSEATKLPLPTSTPTALDDTVYIVATPESELWWVEWVKTNDVVCGDAVGTPRPQETTNSFVMPLTKVAVTGQFRYVGVELQSNAVDHASAKFYTNGVEVAATGGKCIVVTNTPATVVYTAEGDYFFEDGVKSVTYALDTTKSPATGASPKVLDPVKYVAPTYREIDGITSPTNGIAYWTTNSVYNYTAVTSAASAVTWGTAGATSWYVVTNDVTISGRIACTGAVHLVLCEGSKLTASAGITVSGDDNSLAVYGQPDGAGALEAKATGYEAGIGGNVVGQTAGDGQNITVNGGTVTAMGGTSGGAGIGGAGGFLLAKTNCGAGKNITINGGTVTATGGAKASGIGSGGAANKNKISSGSYLTINGGTVTATGGQYGAGIGGGYMCDGAFITINDGRIWVANGGGCELIGSGKGGSAANNVTIVDEAKVMFDIADGSGLPGGQPLPEWEDFAILTPETPVTRVLVGGCGDGPHGVRALPWVLTNAVTGATSNITVNGEMVYFANRFLTLTNDVSKSNLTLKAVEPVSFTPTAVVHTANRVSVGGEEVAGSAPYLLPSNATASVVYKVNEKGWFFRDGTTVKTNELDTAKDPVAYKAEPEQPVAAIQVGDDAWALIADGVCLVVGTSDMWSYETAGTSVLWNYRNAITNVVVAGDVTRVGANVFSYMKRLRRVEVGASVTNVAHDAFFSAINVTNVVLGAGMESVGANAFRWCNSLTTVKLPASSIEGFDEALTVTARITMVGGKPVVDWVPKIEVEGLSHSALKGKVELSDEKWEEIDDPAAIDPKYHFFKVEYQK